MSFIKLEKVNKVYVNKKNISTALNKVSLNFNMGEVVGIVGKSGSGKTTLINIIFGIESFDEGNLYVNDIKSDEMTRDEWDKFRQQECAFIFQDLKIFDNLTVYENIELGLLNIDEEERKKIIFEYLKKFELDDFWDKKSYKLSGGQKQKVAIIRALAKNAKIIVADEPTSNLDEETRNLVYDLLLEQKNDKLVILVTHNEHFIKDKVTKLVKIEEGNIYSIKENKSIECQYHKDNERNQNIAYKKICLINKYVIKSNIKILFFLFLTSFLLALVLFFFTENRYDKIYSTTSKDYIFSNIDDRIIISKKDNSTISSLELSNLSNEFGVEYIKDDYLLDIDFPVTITTDKEKYQLYAKSNVYDCFDNIDVGRIPEKYNEVILNLPVSYKGIIKKSNNIKFDNFLNFETGANIFQVVGYNYYTDNRIKPSVSFNEEGYYLATYLSKFNSKKTIINLDGQGKNLFISNLIEENSLFFYGASDEDLNVNIYIYDYEGNQYADNYQMKNCNTVVKNQQFAYVNYKTIINLVHNYFEENRIQATLFSEDDIKDQLIEKGYIVISSDAFIQKNEIQKIKIFENVFSLILISNIFIISFAYCFNLFFNENRKKLALIKFLGTGEKVIDKCLLYQIIIIFIPSILMLIIFRFIIYRLAIFLDLIFMPWYMYLFLLALLGEAMLLIYRYNKFKINKVKIASSFR